MALRVTVSFKDFNLSADRLSRIIRLGMGILGGAYTLAVFTRGSRRGPEPMEASLETASREVRRILYTCSNIGLVTG